MCAALSVDGKWDGNERDVGGHVQLLHVWHVGNGDVARGVEELRELVALEELHVKVSF